MFKPDSLLISSARAAVQGGPVIWSAKDDSHRIVGPLVAPYDFLCLAIFHNKAGGLAADIARHLRCMFRNNVTYNVLTDVPGDIGTEIALLLERP